MLVPGSSLQGCPKPNWVQRGPLAASHKDSRPGAALAYYSVFSIGPIIVIAIAVAGLFFGRETVSGQVAASIKDMLGDSAPKPQQTTVALHRLQFFPADVRNFASCGRFSIEKMGRI